MPKGKKTLIDEIGTTVLEKLKDADLKELSQFILEEALYIALMSDLYLVTGRVRAYEADGTTWTPLMAERHVITKLVEAIRKMSQVSIPFTDIVPLGWATPLLESWETALSAGERIGTPPNEIAYASALPNHMRMFLVLGLPGMLRIAVQLTRQLIQLSK